MQRKILTLTPEFKEYIAWCKLSQNMPDFDEINAPVDEELTCPVSTTLPKIPVEVCGRLYDLNSVSQPDPQNNNQRILLIQTESLTRTPINNPSEQIRIMAINIRNMISRERHKLAKSHPAPVAEPVVEAPKAAVVAPPAPAMVMPASEANVAPRAPQPVVVAPPAPLLSAALSPALFQPSPPALPARSASPDLKNPSDLFDKLTAAAEAYASGKREQAEKYLAGTGVTLPSLISYFDALIGKEKDAQERLNHAMMNGNMQEAEKIMLTTKNFDFSVALVCASRANAFVDDTTCLKLLSGIRDIGLQTAMVRSFKAYMPMLLATDMRLTERDFPERLAFIYSRMNKLSCHFEVAYQGMLVEFPEKVQATAPRPR